MSNAFQTMENVVHNCTIILGAGESYRVLDTYAAITQSWYPLKGISCPVVKENNPYVAVLLYIRQPRI